MPSKNNFPLSNAALESKMAAFIKDRSAQNLAAIRPVFSSPWRLPHRRPARR